MPAVSKAQQRFFGMVRATQKGEMENPSSEVAQAASSMSKSDVKKFAKTKHDKLPEKKVSKEETKYDRYDAEKRKFAKSDARMKHGKKWKEFTQDVERVRSKSKGIRGTHKGKWGTFNKGVFTPDS